MPGIAHLKSIDSFVNLPKKIKTMLFLTYKYTLELLIDFKTIVD